MPWPANRWIPATPSRDRRREAFGLEIPRPEPPIHDHHHHSTSAPRFVSRHTATPAPSHVTQSAIPIGIEPSGVSVTPMAVRLDHRPRRCSSRRLCVTSDGRAESRVGTHHNRKCQIQSRRIGWTSWVAPVPRTIERLCASSEGAASQRNTWQVPGEDFAAVAKVEPSGEKAT